MRATVRGATGSIADLEQHQDFFFSSPCASDLNGLVNFLIFFKFFFCSLILFFFFLSFFNFWFFAFGQKKRGGRGGGENFSDAISRERNRPKFLRRL